jgi:hypothetical protein
VIFIAFLCQFYKFIATQFSNDPFWIVFNNSRPNLFPRWQTFNEERKRVFLVLLSLFTLALVLVRT